MPHKDPEARRAYQQAYGKRHYRANLERITQQHAAYRLAHRQEPVPFVPNHEPKICTQCSVLQAYDAFPLRPTKRDPENRRNTCKVCIQIAQGPKRLARANARYRENHAVIRSRMNQRTRERRALNPEPFRLYERAYKRAHPELVATANANRRSYKASAPLSDLTTAQWREIQAAQEYRCAYCGTRCKGRLTQDHIRPLSKGGSHTLNNVIGACASCNSKKHTGPPPLPVQPLLLTLAPSKKKKAS